MSTIPDLGALIAIVLLVIYPIGCVIEWLLWRAEYIGCLIMSGHDYDSATVLARRRRGTQWRAHTAAYAAFEDCRNPPGYTLHA